MITSGKDPVDLIGPLQLEVIQYLWNLETQPGAATVNDIHEFLNDYRKEHQRPELAYTTYLTVCRNLVRRKFVTQEKRRLRAHVFIAAIEREQYEKRVLTYVLDGLFNGDRDRMLASMEVG